MLNHIVLMGRLTRDPELRRTGSGIAVASFTLAVDRDYAPKDGGARETDFIDIVAWRSTAEPVAAMGPAAIPPLPLLAMQLRPARLRRTLPCWKMTTPSSRSKIQTHFPKEF